LDVASSADQVLVRGDEKKSEAIPLAIGGGDTTAGRLRESTAVTLLEW